MKTQSSSIKKDIAIIGISGTFPKSENVREFWQNLIDGNELIQFYSKEELEAKGVDLDVLQHPDFVRAKSLIDNPENFDYPFFGYTKEEATMMDPQIRILHQQVWHGIEDAGYDVTTIAGKVGLFFAASDNLNWRAFAHLSASEKVNPFLANQISNKNFISTLVSYSLNLKGPSYYIDTACSSSLVAVHLACRNLLLKECSMALAGGIKVESTTDYGYFFQKGMIHSSDGHCRAFDAQSSGTIGGEGVGVVVLKRMEDALRDRDSIYAVIKSSATNNDGKRKIGYSAPSVIGQSECIQLAHQIAQIAPETISYLEAHGTGTALGDSIEIEALNDAFRYNTNSTCAIGSVKTNIGHLDSAAGIAGLIKTTLAIKHKMIPPSLYFTKPNPEIDFKSGPFKVNNSLRKWENETNLPLRAGVSSFGIGGTNAHLILEEAPQNTPGSPSRTYQLIPFSAKTKSALTGYRQRLQRFFETDKAFDLADMAYTLKTGRQAFNYRQFVVCRDTQDGLAQLKELAQNNDPVMEADSKRKIVFLFQGQGGQYFEMAKKLYFKEPYFKEIVDRGLQFLKDKTGKDYSPIIGFSTDKDTATTAIHETLNAHVLLFIIEYGLARLLINWGLTPQVLFGHSLGEYVAACISEVFSYEDALGMVLTRAELMNEMERGAMIGVEAAASEIAEWMPSDLSIALVNTESTCVVSGSTASIDAWCQLLDAKTIAYSKLKVSHAFHSRMMDPVVEAYKNAIATIPYKSPKYNLISSITGQSILADEITSPAYWANHLRQTVNFSKATKHLLEKGNYVFIELGAGNTLSNFIKQDKLYLAGKNVCVNLLRSHKESWNEEEYLMKALGRLWSLGMPVDWNAFYKEETRQKISIPPYYFDTHKLPARVDAYGKLLSFGLNNPMAKVNSNPSDWIYGKGWKEVTNNFEKEKGSYDWTIYMAGADSFSEKMIERLQREKGQLLVVKTGTAFSFDGKNTVCVNPEKKEDYQQITSLLTSDALQTRGRIIHGWQVGTLDGVATTQVTGYASILNTIRALTRLEYSAIDLIYVVNNLFRIYGNEKIEPQKSTALGALKVIPKEYERINGRCIEFMEEALMEEDTLVDQLYALLESASPETTLGIRGKKIWKPFYEKRKVAPKPTDGYFATEGLYVITGAMGGMGKTFTDFLYHKHHAELVLIGRAPLKETLAVSMHYIQDDLSDAKVLAQKLKEVLLRLGREKIDGIIHTAGIGDYAGLIKDRSFEDCEKVFLAKVSGTQNLFTALNPYAPRFFFLCSSLASVVAPYGQVAYVAANIYQNFFALANQTETKIISVSWDVWKETGMAIKNKQRFSGNKHAENQIEVGMTNAQGLEVFGHALNSGSSELIVSLRDIGFMISSGEQNTLKNALDQMVLPSAEATLDLERFDLTTPYKAPESKTEEKLCELWQSFFGYHKIGVKDTFFELGGDSLKAITLLKNINEAFGVDISLLDFFKKNCIEELAAEIDLIVEVGGLRKSETKNKKTNQIRL